MMVEILCRRDIDTGKAYSAGIVVVALIYD